MYKLVDTHAHLEEIDNLGQALTEAKAANVIAVIAVGSDYGSNQKVLSLAENYSGFVFPALGLHPASLGSADLARELEFIEAHINSAVGIGEVGLDYHQRVVKATSKTRQKQVLGDILQIAKRHDKPVLVHSRYAWSDALALLEAAQITKAVFHWYTGPLEVLRAIVDRGYFISATPAVEYHREHRQAIEAVPLANLLLETDAPVIYRRGSQQEYESKPAHVLKALEGVAQLKGVSEAEIAGATTDNAIKLFGLVGLIR